MSERRLADVDLRALMNRRFRPSPAAWEDEVLYFLMLDRFSDGRERGYRDNGGAVVAGGTTPLFAPADSGAAVATPADAAAWRDAGGRWVGGTLRGLETKLGYLRRLGVTAIWVSPVFKQAAFAPSYHGYGVQNFLDVDPHFGTRDDLKRLVDRAHDLGIRVILDIILNHAGDVFGYAPDRYWTDDGGGGSSLDARWDGQPYPVAGWRDATGAPSLPFARPDPATADAQWPDGLVWPQELQEPGFFTQKGRISNWDWDPEFVEGDFYDLKDIGLGEGTVDHFTPSPALLHICRVYKFWMAFADVDGYRIDTVKHMPPGATRYFASVMHEFAQRLGKERFYLIGEVTGGRQRAYRTLEATGIDAALGIDDIPDHLESLVKGQDNPEPYFDLFRNSLLVRKESHVWFRDKVVTTFDDHDQVRKGSRKARFAAGPPENRALLLSALALNATTLGIPCLYYGSEQGFDGEGDSDRYIREAMFGGAFGAFRSRGRHCFDESFPVYRELARILEVRRREPALRRGRQYLREISGDGIHFGFPRRMGGRLRSVVAWSRLFDDREVVCAMNTDPGAAAAAWVTVDDGLHEPPGSLRCLYSTDAADVGRDIAIERRNGKAVRVTVPAAGFVILGPRDG